MRAAQVIKVQSLFLKGGGCRYKSYKFVKYLFNKNKTSFHWMDLKRSDTKIGIKKSR